MVKNGYLYYLMDSVGANSNMDLLCHELLNIPFTWEPHFMTDGNRADDGLDLRRRYYHDTGEVCDINGTARVLEVLVALAVRIDLDITGEPGMSDPDMWFGIMLENLGLSHMTDRYFKKKEVYEKIDRWLKREYKRNGEGSLFPLKSHKLDQRGITIWDQANEFILERY